MIFFKDRILGSDLHRAVLRLLQESCYEARALGKDLAIPHVWLTQKAEAAKQVCYAYLKIIYHLDENTINEADAMYADPDAGGGKILIREGMIIRLTRNLDKEEDSATAPWASSNLSSQRIGSSC